MFSFTSPKTEIARSVRGPKSQGRRAEDAFAEPYLVQKILVIWLQPITKFTVKVVNLETIIDMRSRVQDLATQWIQSYPCRTKTSQETERSLQKFFEPNGKPEVIYTDNSLEIGKACEDLSGIIVRRHHTDRKQMGLLREQYAE